MFRTRTGPHALAVAVAALGSVIIAGLAAAPPAGASSASSPVSSVLSLAHQSTAGPARPLAERPPGSPLPTVPVTSIETAPAAPGLDPLQASAYDVVVSWRNRADNATSFTVYRLDIAGNWQALYQVAKYGAGSGEVYSWTDTNTVLSGQCYMVAAVNASGASDSQEECTVRPDGGQFPLGTLPHGTQQWYGLSGANDGTGTLQSAARAMNSLVWSNETFGVNLAWTSKAALWKVQAQDGPNAMYGEAVALRVWGGGWLEYGNQTFGVDLQLTSTPVYQWYILGETPGNTVDSNEFALWNSAAKDFLVEGHQTFGVDVNWFKKLPSNNPPPPPASTGVRDLVLYNCVMDDDPLEIWVNDFTAGSGWTDEGTLQPGWEDDEGCGETPEDSWQFAPVSGHDYEVRSVDFDADGCSNDPTISSCTASDTTFVGDSNGGVVTIPIG
jgi:hypothetical protein